MVRRGPTLAELVRARTTDDARALAGAGKERAVLGPAVQDRAGLCGRTQQR